MPVYVRSTGEPCRGLEGLVERGAGKWGTPETPSELREIVSNDASRVLEPAGSPQRELFPSRPEAAPRVSTVRESEPSVLGEQKIVVDTSESPAKAPALGKKEKRLLSVMSGEMRRQDISDALGLSWGHVKKADVDPCLKKGLIEMTMPEKPTSRNQRFRITPDGRACVAAFAVE